MSVTIAGLWMFKWFILHSGSNLLGSTQFLAIPSSYPVATFTVIKFTLGAMVHSVMNSFISDWFLTFFTICNFILVCCSLIRLWTVENQFHWVIIRALKLYPHPLFLLLFILFFFDVLLPQLLLRIFIVCLSISWTLLAEFLQTLSAIKHTIFYRLSIEN